MKKSFVLYTEIWPAIQKLDTEQRGKLFSAIMKHALGEEPEKLDILTDVVFAFISTQMDRAEAKYQEVCKRRAEYGRRGGIASAQAKASKSKQKQANQADNYNEPDNEPDNDNEPERERDNDNDNEAQKRQPGLSLKERKKLNEELGAERVTELIEEVRNWAANNGRDIQDWPAMIRTFESNQRRWGKHGELDLDEVFKGLV